MRGNAVIHFIKCNLGMESPHSQTTTLEQQAIAQYSKNASSAIEIGVYEGVNTIIIANSIDNRGKLYAIDPFFKGKLGICYHEKIAKHQVRKNGLKQRVEFVSKLSFDAAADVPDEVDFIFIDGDHSLKGIEKDWELFSGKVKHGGIIALHDTSVPLHDPSVAQLGSHQYFRDVIKYDQRFSIIETVDSLNVLRRV